MTQRFNGVRGVVLGMGLVGLIAIGTSACNKAEPVEASKWDIPAVVWDGGAAPSGGAEDSPWAKELRELDLMRSYAGARKDASYAEYVRKFGYDASVKDADSMTEGDGSFDDRDPETGDYVLDAPARWAAQRELVTSVTEDPDGRSAVIEDCHVIYTVGSFHEDVICSAARLTHNDDGTISLEGV
ncbi:MAG: hypothetical protein HGA51_01865, partial [Demequinaceae bacterium]|nr:hypothetical protein [Demequinaceae bacterium]